MYFPEKKEKKGQRIKKVSQRNKKFFEKISSDPEYMAKRNQRKNECRKKIENLLTDEDKKKIRERKREKMADYRKKCKEALSKNTGTEKISVNQFYKSKQAYGKACKRAENALPRSPRKKKIVICGLAKANGLQLSVQMEKMLTKPPLHENVIEQVRLFFIRSDIVYTCPGIHDVVTVWDDSGKKIKKRKLYLLMHLKEVYALFVLEHPSIKISFDKFIKLRPHNVLLLKNQPLDQCRCQIHENFIYLLKSLNESYTDNFWNIYLCNNSDYESLCWKGQCSKCKGGIKFINSVKRGDYEIVTYKNWIKNSNNRLIIEIKEECIGKLKEIVITKIYKFQEHVRIKRIQQHAFELDKKNAKSHVLQLDFAMAYSCEYQKEIQGALWSRNIINLFTAALYSSNLPCNSFLVVTDSKDKGKNSVFTFINKIIDQLPNFNSNEKLIIYTDGPSSEFKNKFCVKIVSNLSKKLKINVQWNYFATSHGKGVVDGIGGSAKALVRSKVKSMSDDSVIIQNSTDFFQTVKILMPNVNVLHVSNTEIAHFVNEKKPWNHINDIQGIRSVHCVSCKDGTHVQLWSHAKAVEPLFETWYPDTWSVVSFHKERMCIKLSKADI
ncbi:unnamed protein product [Meganyctiphanes norvegica]|uniref:Uncharacterized protein n=1 Tax=Meganyctiphanes norvegica TaxID=48144 RepID=A0AAV2RR91_MEGNR